MIRLDKTAYFSRDYLPQGKCQRPPILDYVLVFKTKKIELSALEKHSVLLIILVYF